MTTILPPTIVPLSLNEPFSISIISASTSSSQFLKSTCFRFHLFFCSHTPNLPHRPVTLPLSRRIAISRRLITFTGMKHLPILLFLALLSCGPDGPTNTELAIRIEIADSLSRQRDARMEQVIMDKDRKLDSLKVVFTKRIDSLKNTRRESGLGRFVGTVVKYAK